MKLTPTEKRIISVFSGDLPESLTPFHEIATRLGISEEGVLSAVDRFRRSGLVRRFGATVAHTRVGFKANAMAAWRVAEEDVEEAARVIVSCPNVSHCYQRKTCSAWPFTLYAMIHAETREACEKLAAELSRAMKNQDYTLLFTIREFKKTSPSYFV